MFQKWYNINIPSKERKMKMSDSRYDRLFAQTDRKINQNLRDVLKLLDTSGFDFNSKECTEVMELLSNDTNYISDVIDEVVRICGSEITQDTKSRISSYQSRVSNFFEAELSQNIQLLIHIAVRKGFEKGMAAASQLITKP